MTAETTQTAGAAQAGGDDRALKQKHREMWALGDYPTVADDVIPDLGRILVEACGVQTGDEVLDVAAGSGNAAVPAAERGARVVANDLTPELLAAGLRKFGDLDGRIRWEVGDVEELPYPDSSFDVVLSCVGVMFAPHHQAAAEEMLRVLRPGGTLGLASWTPQGFIGQMFATMKPYAPPPPPGASPPPLWGDEAHVRDLVGDRVTDLQAERQNAAVTRFATPEEFRDYFKQNYGPTIAAYRGLAAQPERAAELDAALVDLARRSWSTDAGVRPGPPMAWEYLLLTARKAR